MNIQWFPGHMAKTRKILAENLTMVDVVIELLDARIPVSSKNPEIDAIVKNKPKISVFNKADLADEKINKEWAHWYKAQGLSCIFIDSIKGKGINDLKERLRDLMKERFEKDREKGRIFRPIRTMVVGIPNVGKSSFINKIAGRASAVTGDKPGVTRSKQWIKLNKEIEMLDTPGILWPKFEDQEVGLNLAFTGAIKDDIIDIIEVAASLSERLLQNYPSLIKERYKLSELQETTGLDFLRAAGKKRGAIISGGEIDYARISTIILDEFRGGKIGKVSLEKPGCMASNEVQRNDQIRENDILLNKVGDIDE